ncbi:MAG: ABC transporter substrate-binding protein [Candidatus Pacebacteria bacterium]|nr:ABC transporter substrate-binding protein [Candidatus Paceibacterota bacterium]
MFRLKLKGLKKWPQKGQWVWFFSILNKKEKIFFSIFAVLFIISFLFLLISFYYNNTKVIPTVGGIYKEGLVGQPRFINPIYATSDIDRDILQLVYSGLMKHNNKGEIEFDIAKSYDIQEDEKVYIVQIKDNIFWHDNNLLTVDDVLFTIQAIQNPEYKSPFRANWIGVIVEKINDFEIKFILSKPYVGFLENLTLKILPKHIWQEISPDQAPLSSYNFKPIGSGPYKIKQINQQQDKINNLILERVKDAYISEMHFYFFGKEQDIQGVDGFGSLQSKNNSWNIYEISLPRYFALFFNLQEVKDKEIRQALKYATDKQVFDQPINSPFLPDFYGFSSFEETNLDLEKANEILDKKGFILNSETGYREKIVKNNFSFSQDLKIGSQGTEVTELQTCLAKFEDVCPEKEITGYFGANTEKAVINFQEKYKQEILDPWGFSKGTGLVSKTTREKLNEICFKEEKNLLQFSISTLDQTSLLETAELLKEQFKKIGVKVNIKKITEQEIKDRKYESFLIGIISGAILDPLPFWHSEQKKDPGYNFSLYENKSVDKVLEELRIISDQETRREKIEGLQEIIIEDIPALFLYTQGYIYNVSSKIKGIEFEKIINPCYRFSQVQDWYIKTKRAWK